MAEIKVGPVSQAVANNTVLASGVIGVTNEGGMKVGPGAWNSLPYIVDADDVTAMAAPKPTNTASASAGTYALQLNADKSTTLVPVPTTGGGSGGDVDGGNASSAGTGNIDGGNASGN